MAAERERERERERQTDRERHKKEREGEELLSEPKNTTQRRTATADCASLTGRYRVQVSVFNLVPNFLIEKQVHLKNKADSVYSSLSGPPPLTRIVRNLLSERCREA